MTTKRFSLEIQKSSDDQFGDTIGIASTDSKDYMGDVVEPTGATWRGRSIVALRDHDTSQPIGRAFPYITNGKLGVRLQWAPPGTSQVADDTRKLVKAGILTDFSVGFNVVEREKIPGGMRFTKWQLVEISVVGVGANPEAMVTQKRLNKSGRRISAATAATLDRVSELHDKMRSMHRDCMKMLNAAEKCMSELMPDGVRMDDGDDEEMGVGCPSSKAARLAIVERMKVPTTKGARLALVRELAGDAEADPTTKAGRMAIARALSVEPEFKCPESRADRLAIVQALS